MLERDYIKRLIRQFFEAIEKLKEEREKKDTTDLQLQANSMYRAFFIQPVSFFYEQDVEFILMQLQNDFPERGFLPRVEMLSELFHFDASLQNNPETRKMLLEKSYRLLSYYDTHCDTFSFERRKKIAEIQQSIGQ